MKWNFPFSLVFFFCISPCRHCWWTMLKQRRLTGKKKATTAHKTNKTRKKKLTISMSSDQASSNNNKNKATSFLFFFFLFFHQFLLIFIEFVIANWELILIYRFTCNKKWAYKLKYNFFFSLLSSLFWFAIYLFSFLQLDAQKTKEKKKQIVKICVKQCSQFAVKHFKNKKKKIEMHSIFISLYIDIINHIRNSTMYNSYM